MAPKSIFRGPDAKHFAVVHRSQRDPLINDSEAGERVLHPVQRPNETKARHKKNQGQSRKDLESDLGPKLDHLRPNLGEATMYDIFYDDSDYDYMQHLKTVGLSKEAILLEGPLQSNQTEKRKAKQQDEFLLRPEEEEEESSKIEFSSQSDTAGHLIPDSLLATPSDQLLSYKDHLEFALPAHSALADGLMSALEDPSLQEVLEALENEEFIEEEANDHFFDQIVKDGERVEEEELDWIKDLHTAPLTGWEHDMRRYKRLPDSSDDDDDEGEGESEAHSQVSSYRDNMVSKSQTRRSTKTIAKSSVRGSKAGSAFSMSSSAMFRNEGLTGLDDRFDQIEKEYASSHDYSDSDSGSDDSNQTATPATQAQTREDFDQIMNEFLERYEVLGGKMKPILKGKTPLEKLATMRSELLISSEDHDGNDNADDQERRLMKEKILSRLDEEENREIGRSVKARASTQTIEFETLEDRRDKWDCESILSTYSNIENHPRVIGIRDTFGINSNLTKPNQTKVEIDRHTGFPVVNGHVVRGTSAPSQLTRPKPEDLDDSESDSDSDSDAETTVPIRETIKRDRSEDKESKKARKAEVKAERAARRQEKKSLKETFSVERNKQQKLGGQLAIRKAADVAGVGGKSIMTLL